MGILRTDRVSGLGGANAIKGSVEFRAGQNMRAEIVNGNTDYNLDSSDFTIECWYNPSGTTGTSNSLDVDFIMLWNNTNNRRSWGLYYDSSGSLGLIGSTDGTNSDNQSFHSYTFSDLNAWYHIAAVRISNTATIYVNGTSIGSATVGRFYENTVDNLVVGGQLAGTSYDSKIARGFISNMRLIIGDGIYTGAFTPPANELTVTPNTKLLCCQSPGNILQEATGKTLVAYRSSANDSFAKASTFVPDKGEDHGITFGDNTKFDTLSYMVPPGGTTAQRGRGRGVLGGGAPFVSPNVINAISYVEIQSGGIFKDFGDLTVARGYFSAGHTSSSTRGIFAGGYTGGAGNNTIDYITIATTSNATDFGDATTARWGAGSVSNQTRALFGGNQVSAPFTNLIDFVTIATAANATDFGDLVEARGYLAGASSSTRGVFGGGRNNTPSSNTLKNTMEYVTIATTGNTTDFGDLSATRYGHTGFSSPTRGIFAGGYLAPGQTTTIDYFTIATTGNASDFGDLGTANGYCGSVTNSIRGAVTINDAPNYTNALEYITIATTGNAKDFGDSDPTGSGKGHGDFPASVSDSHGGIS